MKTVKVKAELREGLGKKESKKLREQGIVPVAMYNSDGVMHLSIPFEDLRKTIYTPEVFLLDVEVNGEVHKAIIQDMQWHPVEELLLHMDLFKVNPKKPIKIEIPVKTEGVAKGIKSGGKLNFARRKLKVKALADDLPDEIVIDITKLKIGDSIVIGDLDYEKLNFLEADERIVVGIVVTRTALKSTGVADDEESEEGEASAENKEEEQE